jgi:hypothetical protein
MRITSPSSRCDRASVTRLYDAFCKAPQAFISLWVFSLPVVGFCAFDSTAIMPKCFVCQSPVSLIHILFDDMPVSSETRFAVPRSHPKPALTFFLGPGPRRRISFGTAFMEAFKNVDLPTCPFLHHYPLFLLSSQILYSI